MKKLRFVLFVLTFAAVLLSACGAPAATPSAGGLAAKVDAVPVAFVGVIDSMAGDQWVINGNTVTVAADVVRDGPFNVGDQIKVEGAVSPDGSFTVSRVEPPTAADLSSLPRFGNDNANANINDANANAGNLNVNEANVNADNSNAANSNNGNINDDSGNDANANDDNSNSANSNDDSNANDDNGNDDNGGGSNSNDDNGNDDHSGGDDNSGKGGDDNSGKGGGDDKGGDDNGGNDD